VAAGPSPQGRNDVTRFLVLSSEEAEPDDAVYLRITDRFGDEFEADMSIDEARQLAAELLMAVHQGMLEDAGK